MGCFSVVTFENFFFVFSFHKLNYNVSLIPLSLSFLKCNLALVFRFMTLTKFVKFSTVISLHICLVPLLSSLLLRLDDGNVNLHCKFLKLFSGCFNIPTNRLWAPHPDDKNQCDIFTFLWARPSDIQMHQRNLLTVSVCVHHLTPQKRHLSTGPCFLSACHCLVELIPLGFLSSGPLWHVVTLSKTS